MTVVAMRSIKNRFRDRKPVRPAGKGVKTDDDDDDYVIIIIIIIITILHEPS